MIIGIRMATGTVECLWIQKDGGLRYRGLVHYPRPGRTPAGEAITTFGLIRFRRFSLSQAPLAMAYASELERGAGDDTL
ncbi:hypothetical protein Rumeso_01364 [Rubellimicrobium mesophilum DSM 19309]|uniref:Uncharacterized protein n=1 Tax=Rubellimicrobium mesophilum DSM 19309 TaxID=442562 RepID=A0A017HS15_9RHOB|nr:hypothetical protein Rumeso_01364 [Rubellimicrobium mesophilum DSM 19309]